jgi:hypothetical protein
MKQFHSTVVDKIPLFHEDGEAKFMLQVRTGGEDGEYRGKFQAWSAEKYADLVAITTAAEADVAANLDQAREIGTRIVKWNSTGKGVDFYLRIGDTRCARVDGQYASIEPAGTTINGVYYPYYKSEERLPGRFSICHPNCRHRLTPVPEEVLGGQPQGKAVTAEDLLRDTTVSERAQVIERARLRSLEFKKQVLAEKQEPLRLDDNAGSVSQVIEIPEELAGEVEMSGLPPVLQRIVMNVVKDMYNRNPRLPRLQSIRTARGITTENGVEIIASSDSQALRIYQAAFDYDRLKDQLKLQRNSYRNKNGIQPFHYRNFTDVINHEFGHIVYESAKNRNFNLYARFERYKKVLEANGLLSGLMRDENNEFFPELFLLFRQGRLTGELSVIETEMKSMLKRLFG